MGISFNLEQPHLPTDRHHYPKAPFATLWTQREEDADRAYEMYRGPMKRTWNYRNPFLDVWGGRPSNAPAIVDSYPYRKRWTEAPAGDFERSELSIALGGLSGAEVRMVSYAARRKGAVAICDAGYGVPEATVIAHKLADAGWCALGDTKPNKRRPVAEPAITYARPDRDIVIWEIDRRDWMCELLVRNQFAYEATQSSMISFRESGVVNFVEVVTKECCNECGHTYSGQIPVREAIEIPIASCRNEHGCNCCVLAAVNW